MASLTFDLHSLCNKSGCGGEKGLRQAGVRSRIHSYFLRHTHIRTQTQNTLRPSFPQKFIHWNLAYGNLSLVHFLSFFLKMMKRKTSGLSISG